MFSVQFNELIKERKYERKQILICFAQEIFNIIILRHFRKDLIDQRQN